MAVVVCGIVGDPFEEIDDILRKRALRSGGDDIEERRAEGMWKTLDSTL